MSLWMVRAGKEGEYEQRALETGVVTMGRDELPDLSSVSSKQDIGRIYARLHPNASRGESRNALAQIWGFTRGIDKGDLVALPLKSRPAIAIGECQSEYRYDRSADSMKHIRRVKWLKTLPRSAFEYDILSSFGSIVTVCRIQRNDAENRVREMVYPDHVAHDPS